MEYEFPLVEASGEIAVLTDGEAPGYRKLYGLVLDGRLRAKRVNGRIIIDIRDGAAVLGRTIKVAA